MKRVLLAWVGETDLKAARGDSGVGLGPIAQALEAMNFEHVVLLNNYPKKTFGDFEAWISKRSRGDVVLRHVELDPPTDYEAIYRVASDAVTWTREKLGPKTALTFHLSPGTKPMAITWVILAKTRFEATLIESSVKAGVQTVDFPFDLAAELIPAAVRRADLELDRLTAGLRPEEAQFGDLIGRSDAMTDLVDRARRAAAFSFPVLIEGESGTGKELLASAIHKEGARSHGQFVPVNCGAIPENLVEAEFFGFVKGAFTGAVADKPGAFERAHGGTLFLDEIGDLPLAAQVKLLRALQEKKIQRVGAPKEIPVDARVIAATNRDLAREVEAGRFREDLYFRLAILPLRTPPLREREGDIGLLIDHFLERLRENLKATIPEPKKLSAGAKNLLLRHEWPGNVRQLEAVLSRAYVWSRKNPIDEAEIRAALLPGEYASRDRKSGNVLGRPLGDGFNLADTMGEVARHYLDRAMKESGGNMTKAATLVGIDHYQTLKNWLTKYDVEG